MKCLTIILAIYILGLAIVPCVDGDLAHNYGEVVQTETVFHQNTHDHQDESCTPFCSCQCCQIQLTLFDFSTFEPLQVENYLETPIYRLFVHDYFPKPFFQPPRV